MKANSLPTVRWRNGGGTVRILADGRRLIVHRHNGFISLRASTEDALVARIDTLGRVAGWHLHITSRIPDSVSFGTSAASISRAVREHSIRTTSRDTLNASAKRQVLQLAKWLRARCPA